MLWRHPVAKVNLSYPTPLPHQSPSIPPLFILQRLRLKKNDLATTYWSRDVDLHFLEVSVQGLFVSRLKCHLFFDFHYFLCVLIRWNEQNNHVLRNNGEISFLGFTVFQFMVDWYLQTDRQTAHLRSY